MEGSDCYAAKVTRQGQKVKEAGGQEETTKGEPANEADITILPEQCF